MHAHKSGNKRRGLKFKICNYATAAGDDGCNSKLENRIKFMLLWSVRSVDLSVGFGLAFYCVFSFITVYFLAHLYPFAAESNPKLLSSLGLHCKYILVCLK